MYFGLLPVMLVGVAFVWGFYLYMRRQTESPSKPHVLVDKPPDRAAPSIPPRSA